MPQTESSLTKLLWKNHAFALATCNGNGKTTLTRQPGGVTYIEIGCGAGFAMCCMFIPYTMCVVCLFASHNICSRGAQHKRPAGFSGLVTLQTQAVHTIALLVLVHEGMLQGHSVSRTRARWFL